MADVINPDKPEVSFKRYPKDIQQRLINGEDTAVIIAEMMSEKVQELETAYPLKTEELMQATNDVRAIMQKSNRDIVEKRADWRAATKQYKEEMGL